MIYISYIVFYKCQYLGGSLQCAVLYVYLLCKILLPVTLCEIFQLMKKQNSRKYNR